MLALRGVKQQLRERENKFKINKKGWLTDQQLIAVYLNQIDIDKISSSTLA